MAQSKPNLKETPHSLSSGGNADDTNRVPCPPSQGTRDTCVNESRWVYIGFRSDCGCRVAVVAGGFGYEETAIPAVMELLKSGKAVVRLAVATYSTSGLDWNGCRKCKPSRWQDEVRPPKE